MAIFEGQMKAEKGEDLALPAALSHRPGTRPALGGTR